ENGASRFDLTLDLGEGTDTISGCFEYNTDLFDANTIRHMVEHWKILLADIVADPQQRLADLQLLGEDELQRLCVEWNDTQLTLPPEVAVQRWFEMQVAKTPDAPAMTCEDTTLSYAMLNTAANRLAHCLMARGVGPETLVGLYADRSLEMVIGLIG